MWKLFDVLILFNTKFNLVLGIVRILGILNIHESLEIFIISILNYVHKWLPVGTCVKLICEISQWTASCVFTESTFWTDICGKAENILQCRVLALGEIMPGDAPSHSWGVEGFQELPLICWIIAVLGSIFTLVQIRLIGVKKIIYVSIYIYMCIYIYMYIYYAQTYIIYSIYTHILNIYIIYT